MGIEREQHFRKNWQRQRERESARMYKGQLKEIIKKIEKIDYLNKRGDRIDELM